MGRLCKKRCRTKEFGELLMDHKKYYRKLLLERFKAYFMTISFLAIVVVSPIWLLYITITEVGMTDRINECLKTNSFDYCNRSVK